MKKIEEIEPSLLDRILSDSYTGSASTGDDDGDDTRAADRLERPYIDYDDELEL